MLALFELCCVSDSRIYDRPSARNVIETIMYVRNKLRKESR